MADEPNTAQGWAWDYIRIRLEAVRLSENPPKMPTFADLGEGKLFIRFPKFEIENNELVFKNTELYRKIRTVKYADGSNNHYNALKVATGLLHQIIDDEPVIVVR